MFRNNYFLPLCGLLCLVWAFSSTLFPTWIQSTQFNMLGWGVLVLTLWLSVWRISSRFLACQSFLLQFLVAGFLFQVSASAIVAWLGLATILNLENVYLTVAMIAIVASRFQPSTKETLECSECVFSSRFDRAITFAGLAVGFSAWAIYTFNDLRYTTIDADNMWYHLSMVAIWIQTGSIWPNNLLDEIVRAYPGYRESIATFLSIPLHQEHLANLGGLELALFGLAIYFLGRQWTSSITLAVMAGVYAITIPLLGNFTGLKGNDLSLGLNTALSILFLERFFRRGETFWAVLAGLTLGALAATKFSGIFYTASLFVTFILIRCLSRSSSSPSLNTTHWIWVGIGGLIAAGPWYLRNFLAYYNPVWPAKISLGSWVLFDGPYTQEQMNALKVGWNIQPLFDHANYFIQGYGLLIALIGFSFIGLALHLLLSPKWKQPEKILMMIAWPILFFILYLHQPFSMPSYAYAHNMRFLLPWFVVSLLALFPIVGYSTRSARIAALVFFTGSIWNYSEISHYYLPATILALLLGAVSYYLSLFEKIGSLNSSHLGKLKPVMVVIFFIALFGVMNLRDKMQYTPDYGYRDTSSRDGWGGLCSYIHRDIANKKILVVGDEMFFPLFGDKLDNAIYRSNSASLSKDIFDDSILYDIDYIAAFPWRMDRINADTFIFGKSIAPELVRQYSHRFQIAKKFGSSYLVRVIH
jgi:hypothetical protein